MDVSSLSSVSRANCIRNDAGSEIRIHHVIDARFELFFFFFSCSAKTLEQYPSVN